jgi:hypothetical protein
VTSETTLIGEWGCAFVTGTVYRFVKSEVESLSMLKGENNWYRISDAQDETLYYCHVIGNCLGGASTFHTSRG